MSVTPPDFKPGLYVFVVWDETGLQAHVGCECCDKVVSFDLLSWGQDERLRFINTMPMRWLPRAEHDFG